MVDEGMIGIDNMPHRWFLTARDAFNGVLLWKRPIAHWDWRHWSDPSSPKYNLAHTGKLLWEKGDFVGIAIKTAASERITHLMLAVGGGRVVLLDEDAIVCLDLNTGAEQWRASRPTNEELPRRAGIRSDNLCTLVVHSGIVLFATTTFTCGTCKSTPVT